MCNHVSVFFVEQDKKTNIKNIKSKKDEKEVEKSHSIHCAISLGEKETFCENSQRDIGDPPLTVKKFSYHLNSVFRPLKTISNEYVV